MMIGYDKKSLLKHSLLGATLFLLLLLLKSFSGQSNIAMDVEPAMAFDMYGQKGDCQLELQSMVADYKQKIVALRKTNREMQKQLSISNSLILLLLIIVTILSFNFSKSFSHRKREEDKNSKLKAFLRRKYEISRQYIDDNEKTIAELTRQLNDVSKMVKQKELDYIKLQKQSLELKNEENKLANVRISTSLALIRQSECAMRFSKAITDGRVSLSKLDWQKLSEIVLQEFPLLMQKIDMNPAINDTEKKVVLLVLLDMGTLEMSTIIGLKNSTISSAKKTAYEKLSGMEGSAKDLSREIINIIAITL